MTVLLGPKVSVTGRGRWRRSHVVVLGTCGLVLCYITLYCYICALLLYSMLSVTIRDMTYKVRHYAIDHCS